MTAGDPSARRFSDEMLVRLDERVRLHIKWIEDEHANFKNRIVELEAFRQSIEKPVHAAGWVIIGLVGSFLAAVGTYVWKILTRLHFG